MKTRRWVLFTLLALCSWNVFAAAALSRDIYQGTVVDGDTDEPLTDAVLVVIWWTKPFVRVDDGPRYFHDAKEALTDSNGKFSLDITPKSNWNPFYYIESSPPTTIIYKPAYRPLTGSTAFRMGFPKSTDLDEALKKGVVIKLSRLKTQEEARRYVDLGTLDAFVPPETIPNLVRLVNIQRQLVGLNSYPEPTTGGKLP